MRTALLLALVLVSCKKDPEPADSGKTDPPVDCSTVTDTVPQFCGEVPKNLIFLSIDTFRKDMLTRYGGDGHAPTLDRLAAEGLVLDDNIQCSNWTFASTTCTLMGQTNINSGFMPRLSGADPVTPGIRFLPGYLADEDYWSVLVSSNAWLSDTWGNGRDYSQVVYPGGGRITGVADNGLNALNAAKGVGLADKWFLHLHGLEPHAPYIPPDSYLDELANLDPLPFDVTSQEAHYQAAAQWPALEPDEQALLEQHLKVRYAGEVKLYDDGLAAVLDRLDKEGLLDDALVVVWTDHGEQFWEHGRHTHAHTLFGEENDGLAIFWSKNIVAQEWTEPTMTVDLVPTILNLYGMEVPEGLDGMVLGTRDPAGPRFTAVAARQGEIQAVLKDGWRLTFPWNHGSLTLTRPAEDALEPELDLEANAEVVHELWALLEPKVQEMVDIVGYEPVAGYPTLPPSSP